MTKLFEPCSTGKRYRRCLDETTKAPRHRVKGAFFTLCVLVSWCSAFSGAQSQLPKWEIRNSKPEIRNLNPGITDQDSPELTLGVPIERRLGASEVHTYRITLAFGQYLRVVVEELGIPVVVSVLKPDGERLIEAMSLYSTYEPIQVSVLADAPGIYRLEVRPQTKTATGKYTVRMEELRDAMPQDKNRVAAESAIAEASRLYEEGTATSRRKAIGKLEEAIPLWQAIDEGGGEGRTLNLIGAFHNELGEWQKALDYYQQALPLLRAAGDRRGEAYSLNDTGNVYRSWGEPLKALNYFDQALLLSRAVGDRNWEAVVLEGIAEVQRSLGKQHEALRFYGQVLPLFRAMGDPSGEEETVALIGEIYPIWASIRRLLDIFRRRCGSVNHCQLDTWRRERSHGLARFMPRWEKPRKHLNTTVRRGRSGRLLEIAEERQARSPVSLGPSGTVATLTRLAARLRPPLPSLSLSAPRSTAGTSAPPSSLRIKMITPSISTS